MRVEQFLNESAARLGNKAAIVAAGREHSYADLARSSDRVAAALRSRGVKRGERVALFMDDNFEAVVSAFAVLKAGAVATPISAASSAENLLSILSLSGVVAIITQARLAAGAAVALAGVASIRLVILCGGDRSTASSSCLIYEDVVRGIGRGPTVERAGTASDAALMLHGLDGDGAPVAEWLTHAEVIAAAATAERGERTLSSILSHYGLCQLFAATRAGATLVLETPSVFRRVALADGGAGSVVPALAV